MRLCCEVIKTLICGNSERCPCSGDEGYDCGLPGFHCSAMNILNKMAAIQSKSQSGATNDMDMLEVGNGG